MRYFDGSEAGELGLLYIRDDHYFTYKAGMGFGTNNFDELLTLKLLLTLTLKKHISIMQIFGDSKFAAFSGSSRSYQIIRYVRECGFQANLSRNKLKSK